MGFEHLRDLGTEGVAFYVTKYITKQKGEYAISDSLGFVKHSLCLRCATEASLRDKLEHDPKRPQLVLTVEGVGYKFAGLRDP
jgi:hypothetical protein